MALDAPPADVTAAAAGAGAAPRWAGGWWLLPPLVLAVLGGWLVARRYGFWYDELFTAEMAPLGLGELAEAVVRGEGTVDYLRDAPPSYNAPYYAVVHLWLALTPFGADEIGLRLFSLVAGVAAVSVFTRAVARLADRGTGLVAGLVLATNPMFVSTARQVRGYSLVVLLCLVSTLALLSLLGADARPARRACYVAAVAFAVGTHLYAGLVLVGHAALVAARGRLGSKWVATWAVSGALGLAVYAAQVDEILRYGREQQRRFTAGFPNELVSSLLGGHVVAKVLLLVLVALGVFRFRHSPALRWVASAYAALVAVVWLVVQPALHARFFLFALPLVALAVAAAVQRVPVLAVLALTAALASGSAVARVHDEDDIANRAAASLIEQARLRGERACGLGESTEALDVYTARPFTVLTGAQLGECDLAVALKPALDSSLVAEAKASFPYRKDLPARQPGMVLRRSPPP